MSFFLSKRWLVPVLPVVQAALCAILLACGVLAPASGQRFSPPVILTTGNDPAFLQAADFTGKGLPELLALDGGGAATGAVRTLTNSKGTFSLGPAVPAAGSSILAMPLRPGGLPDLYWTSTSGSQATLFRANAQPDGSYLPGVALTSFPLSGSIADSPLVLAAAGLHAGYENSVVIADIRNNQLYTVLPNPDGTYAIVPVYGQPGMELGFGPTQLLSADINGAGLPDLLVSVTTGVQIFLAQGTTNNFTGFAPPTLHPSMGVQSMALADMDGDGHPDLVQELGNGQVEIYHGNPDGSFAPTSEVGTGADNVPLGNVGYIVGVADLNADGMPDLVFYNNAGTITVLQGTGSRNFQTSATYAVPINATQFVFTDFNGDGKPDIAFNVPQGVAVMYSISAAAPAGQLTASPEPSLYGAAITLTLQFTATAAGSAPTGTVNFSVDGTAAGSGTISNSQATYTISAPQYKVGQHVISADYAGDGNYGSATFTGTHAVQGLPTTSSISDLVTPIYYGQEIGYTNGIDAVVDVEPAGSDPPPPGATIDGGLIYVYLDGQLVCSLTKGAFGPTGGPQRCNDANFQGYPAGTHTMVAAYQGNDYYAPSQSITYPVVILPDDTTAQLTTSLTPAPYGTPVTFTATLAAPYAVPTGTVVFMDGGVVLGTGTLNAAGVATFTTSTLAVGSHAITASYSATQNFNASQSGLTQVIVAAVGNPSTGTDFTLTVTPADISVGIGNVGTINVTVTPGTNFSEPVSLSCAGLSQEATCSFTASVLPAAGGTTQLAVHPEAPHNCSDSNQYFIAGSSGRLALGLAAATALLFGARRRKLGPIVFAAALCVLPLLGGCGAGNCTDLGTRPGTYSFTVTGAATGNVNVSHTQTVVVHAVLTEPVHP